jgi:hypothetical protein
MKISKICILILLLPFSFAFIDFLNINTTNVHNHFSLFKITTIDEQIYWLLIYLAFTSLILISYSITATLKFSYLVSKRIDPSNFEKKLNNYVLILLMCIAFYKLINIFDFGFIDYLLLSRAGKVSQGFMGHMVLLFMPLILSMEFKMNKPNVYFYVGLVVFTILCAASGYRIHFVVGLTLFAITNSEYIYKFRLKMIIITTLIGFSLLTFEMLREQYFGASYSDRSLLDSVNRTHIISFSAYIDEVDFNLDLRVFLHAVLSPIEIVLNHFEILNKGDDFFISNLYTPLFTDYLVWRGTPKAIATGFSTGFFPTAFIFDKFIGLLVFSILYGSILAIGKKLITSGSYVSQLTGAALLGTLVYSNESLIVSVKSMIYWLSFITIIALFINIIYIHARIVRGK